MNVRKNIKNRLKINLLLLFITTTSFGQNFNDLSLSLKKTFFQLDELNFKTNISPDSINNGKISIHSLKFGFDDIKFDNIRNENISAVINGPNLFLDHVAIKANYLLPNFYNLLLSDLSDRRFEVPIDGINILEKAINAFYQKFNRVPDSYDDLIVNSLIKSSIYPFNNNEWSYHFYLPDSLVATTTSYYKQQKKSISYDLKTKSFLNKDSDPLSNERITWSFNFEVNDIRHSFLSDLNMLFPDDFMEIEFYQKQGKFNLGSISLFVIPDNDIFEQTIFQSKNIKLEINDLFLSLIKNNNLPNVKNGNGTLSIKNLELKIPPSLANDETVKILMRDLGIRNGLLRFRRIDISFRFYDSEFGSINLIFDSSFLKINVDGQFSINTRKDDLGKINFFDTEIRINPISYGMRDIIREWELKNNKNLNREGSVIVINLSGPANKPLIIGID